MKQIRKHTSFILVALVVLSLATAGYYYRQSKQLRSVMITASAELVGEDVFISLRSMRGALSSSIESQELTYQNNKQVLDRCNILWRQFDYLEEFDLEHRDEWDEFESMSRELWYLFNQLEQKILPDDAIELDEEQIELLTGIYDNLGIVSGITEIEFPGFDAQHLDFDELMMSQSLEASDNIVELAEEGFIVFSLDTS